MNAGPVALALPHHEAILTALKAIAPGSATNFAVPYLGVYDGEVPTSPPLDRDGRVRAYCVLWAGVGVPSVGSLCGSRPGLDYTFGVNAVGGDQRRCMWARDRVMTALEGARLTVPGRSSGLVYAGPSTAPVQRTDAAGPPRFVAALSFAVTTV